MLTVHIYGLVCTSCCTRISWAATESGAGVQADHLHAFIAAHQGHRMESFHLTKQIADHELEGVRA